MRFEPESNHGANAGLNVARNLMEKVKAEFPWISYGDLWTLAGVCAIQVSGPYSNSVCGCSDLGRKWLVRRSPGVRVVLMVSPRKPLQMAVYQMLSWALTI